MSAAYVERRDGACVIAGTRVSLDSVVYSFQMGHAADGIAQAFPVRSLGQVNGAI